jgi:hypothetical protein
MRNGVGKRFNAKRMIKNDQKWRKMEKYLVWARGRRLGSSVGEGEMKK